MNVILLIDGIVEFLFILADFLFTCSLSFEIGVWISNYNCEFVCVSFPFCLMVSIDIV